MHAYMWSALRDRVYGLFNSVSDKRSLLRCLPRTIYHVQHPRSYQTAPQNPRPGLSHPKRLAPSSRALGRTRGVPPSHAARFIPAAGRLPHAAKWVLVVRDAPSRRMPAPCHATYRMLWLGNANPAAVGSRGACTRSECGAAVLASHRPPASLSGTTSHCRGESGRRVALQSWGSGQCGGADAALGGPIWTSQPPRFRLHRRARRRPLPGSGQHELRPCNLRVLRISVGRTTGSTSHELCRWRAAHTDGPLPSGQRLLERLLGLRRGGQRSLLTPSVVWHSTAARRRLGVVHGAPGLRGLQTGKEGAACRPPRIPARARPGAHAKAALPHAP